MDVGAVAAITTARDPAERLQRLALSRIGLRSEQAGTLAAQILVAVPHASGAHALQTPTTRSAR